MYDIIGDVHGHADELIELLDSMGYELRDGAYRHVSRMAVFVGDFIDRGPQIAEVLSVVRAMHAAGTALAVMGNHEFNALAFHTEHPSAAGQFLRTSQAVIPGQLVPCSGDCYEVHTDDC